jgi:hypothetical protein
VEIFDLAAWVGADARRLICDVIGAMPVNEEQAWVMLTSIKGLPPYDPDAD